MWGSKFGKVVALGAVPEHDKSRAVYSINEKVKGPTRSGVRFAALTD
jgi:hypothetical protein